jgi:hypothetical protein
MDDILLMLSEYENQYNSFIDIVVEQLLNP